MGSLIFLLQLAKKHIICDGVQSLFAVLTIAISDSLLFFFRGYGLNVLDIARESTVWDKNSHLNFLENNVILVMSTLVIIITVTLYLLLQYIMVKSIARRQREIELFTILGASSREIVGGFLCEVCLIVTAGLILGGGLSVWGEGIYLEVIVVLSQLFEFNLIDPVATSTPLVSLLSVSIEIISISVLAALIAVKRGVRKSRLIALNCERR